MFGKTLRRTRVKVVSKNSDTIKVTNSLYYQNDSNPSVWSVPERTAISDITMHWKLHIVCR